MEEDDLSERCLRTLNLNAPILSTKRIGGALCVNNSDANRHGSSNDTSKRIPFSWEQVPGTPKGVARRSFSVDYPPPPKLPPSQWHPSKEKNDVNCGDYDHTYKNNNGDVDGKGDDENDDDVFSDAVDMFSISDSLDIADSARKLHDISPNFIIHRFLPDANALAASYVPSVSRNLNKTILPPEDCLREYSMDVELPVEYVPRVVGRSCSKACGMGLLFPWRIKHMPCGLKKPVRRGSPIVKLNGNTRRIRGASIEGPSRGGGKHG